MTTSRSYEELRNAWKGWRDVSGKTMRAQYQEYVELLNKAIKVGGMLLVYNVRFIIISLFAIFYFKNHDDFPYYHLSFMHNITLNKVEFGLGNFDLAYNHVSSLFFFIHYLNYHLLATIFILLALHQF